MTEGYLDYVNNLHRRLKEAKANAQLVEPFGQEVLVQIYDRLQAEFDALPGGDAEVPANAR